VGHAPDPGRRAEVHDCRRRLRFLYGTGESLAHVERAFEVDRQDFPPNLGIGIQNVADSPDASAVDQPIEFSEPSNRSGHERGHLVPVRNVNTEAKDPSLFPNSDTTLSTSSFRTSAATIDAPSANNRRTQAAPIPLPAPVTK